MSKRMIICFCGFCLICVGLIFRLGSIEGDASLKAAAAKRSSYTLTFDKTRGMIYDCKLNPLVETKTEYAALCLPTPSNTDELLSEKRLNGGESTEELIKSGKPFLVSAKSGDIEIENVTILPIRRRTSGALAAHVLGYTDNSGGGISGIEKAYNELLEAQSDFSTVTCTVNAAREALIGEEPRISYAPIITGGVSLTLDSRIQELCETVGKKYLKKGAIVIMEPQSGKLRAVASFPSYDADNISAAMKDGENAPLINRAFYSYNVGSTFKIVTAAAALTQGISHDTTFECTGSADIFGQVFGCHLKSGHGPLNLRQGLELSCNPYFIQLGQALNPQEFLNMARDLSFSKSAELAPGIYTKSGTLPTVAELQSPAALANFSFGQGALTATPIQVAQMTAAVVNGGATPTPQLIEGFTSDGKLIDEKIPSSPHIKAMSEEIAETIKQDLTACVMETPSQKAKPKYVTAGGKTGTAQTGQYVGKEEKLQGWFVGFFPAEEPKYVAAIVAEDAVNGNQNASPIFAEIADALYKPLVYGEN